MTGSWLYRAARFPGRIALRFYFSRFEIVGRENLPARGPLLVAASHPQSITDALVLGAALDRELHFLAHSGLFSRPVTAFVLRRAGVIPVYRRGEGDDAATRNVETFRECRAALEAGQAIAIFPEGVSKAEPRLQQLRTGTARIALDAEEAHRFALGVRIVPVGISFESRRRFRSRVLLNIGRPIEAAAYRDAYRDDPRAAVVALTGTLRGRLGDLVVNVERSEMEPLIEDIEETYRDELLRRPGLEIAGGSPLARDITLSREIARAVDHYLERDPEWLWQLAGIHREYRRKRERLRVSESFLRSDRAPRLRAEAPRLLAVAISGFPIWAYGTLWNILPYRLTGWAAKRKCDDETKLHWYQLSYGTVIYGIYYPPLMIAAAAVLGAWGMAGFGLSLIPTGFFARWYARALAHRRAAFRYAWLSVSQTYYLQEIRRLRLRLLDEMDQALRVYLETRRAGVEESQGGP